ncbi:MAG: hypothetical protein GY856_51685 [bacterium]|nr:hypothetical protein [bacterium]
MKIKLDEHLPTAVARCLASLGHDVETVHDEGLGGQDDDHVWEAAQAEKRFLITQDLDFSDIRKYTPGSHSGLLLLRLRNPGRSAFRGIRWPDHRSARLSHGGNPEKNRHRSATQRCQYPGSIAQS